MFIGFGTTLNIFTILLGAALGVSVGNRFKESTRALMMDVLGAVTLISAAASVFAMWDNSFVEAVPKGGALLVVLAALLIGGGVGSFVDIESKLERSGVYLKNKLDKDGKSPFVEGFVTASLIFVIGPLAILGSISDGMGTGVEQLTLKSILDFFAAMAFAAALGWGVAASALPVGIYQFFWTGIGLLVGQVLSDYQISAMTAVGGVLLFGIALKLLKIKEIAIGNLLPSLALAPFFAWLASYL
ncbi:MAG: DUF554 domain-containing protein [Candidatus Nanopelagicaceae bacterium]|nr:DUF554 domain-containing protein [Candidatus Nanopelagicaceae bacterium]